MAIKQVVPILITLQGDGSNTAFTYALRNLYQAGIGGSIPFGTTGVVPSSIAVNNPPVAVTSSTVDADGNITITFTTAPGAGTQYTLEVDLIYNSGAATSSSATQSMNVNVTGGTITATESFTASPGSALPTNAAYIGGNNAGNIIGVAVDSSGNVGVNVIGALPAGSATIGAVTQASGPWTQNITQVGGSGVSLGSKTSANSIPVVVASDQAAITIAQATAASLNATVVNAGTFAVQAGQSGTWNIGTVSTVTAVTGITNAVTVVGDVASGGSNAGNPVKIGGVFNTTQPTVTNGQAVDAQMTARGALIVATGTDTFTVAGTVAATQSGTWTHRIVGNAGDAMDGAQNSAAPANALVIAGVYNSVVPTITSGYLTALQTDASGFLKVNVSAGSSGNAAASATGSAVPASADYAGLNVSGNLRGWTGVNPSGSVYAGQIDLSSIAGSTTSTAASGVLKVGIVGSAGAVFDQVVGSAIPANAIQMGGTDGTNLQTVNLRAKGTQGSYAVAVQDLKDSGRTYIVWTIDAATLVTTEALISTAVNKGGTPQSSATTYTVTTGKTLRLQSVSASVQGTNSAVQYVKVRVRSASSVTVSSAAVLNLFVANSGSSNSIGFAEQVVPDGLEIASGQQVGISQIGGTVNGNVSITLVGFEY